MVEPAQVRKDKHVVGGEQDGATDDDGNCQRERREQTIGSFVITPRAEQCQAQEQTLRRSQEIQDGEETKRRIKS